MPGRRMASRGGIIDASATSQFMSLSRQVKTALDETRLLMLGAQVLFGFKLNGVFQEEFANLSVASRYVDCAGQVLMAMAIGLLVAPSMQHRIVENGEDTVRIHRIAGVFAGMALLPFAVSLGLGFYIVFDHVFGMTAAFVAGSAFCLLAGVFWYGLGFSLRPKSWKRTMQEEKPTPLTTKIEQMLTEARIIVPGAQALLGFQLTVTLTNAFGQLPESLKLCPRRIAVLCRPGHHPADDTRRASSHFVCGGGYTILPHYRVLVRHPCARATGDRHCGGSLCRNLNGGGIVDARRHSCACRAFPSSLPLVHRTDGAEGARRRAHPARPATRGSGESLKLRLGLL